MSHARRAGFGALALACGLGAAVPVTAAAAPGDPKGEATAVAVPSGPGCDLRPTANRSPRHEWLSCIGVTATLDRVPAVGGTATLRVEVRADAARPGAEITVELPAGLEFANAPAGARVARGRSAGGAGTATLATSTADLGAGTVRHLTADVRATAAGPAHVRVRAVAATPWGADAGSDDVFLTVGTSERSSRLGFTPATEGGVTAATGTPVPRTGRHEAVPTAGLPRPHSDDATAPSTRATSCATGTWHFLDEGGALRPSINYQVQVWDDDSSTGDDLLVTGVTSFSGGYNLCFDGADGEGGGQEVYVQFISSNSLWRVRNTPAGNTDYVNSTGVQAICDGCTANFGGLMPGNDIHRGMNAFDAANDAWVFVPSACWDGNDATCRQVVINWTAASVDGTYYSLAGNDVHLAADDPNAPSVTIHEVGHAVMDDVYEDDYPPNPNCSPHSIQGASSTGCAWTEGFAEWFPASVLNDPFFRWPDGASLDLENHTWGTAGWANGDAVEGRVAGALIDISDSANEATWDRFGEGDPGNIWTTFQNNVSDTLLEFWSDRASSGFSTANSGPNAAVYQNTIDYTFRDPLGDYAELSRPTPTPHNYGYSTSSAYWSVVATRPPAGTDYDLTLYDDVGQTVNLGGSAFGGSTIDFVAVDSNHRALGDYYPRAYQFSGTGTYQVELAQGSNQLNLGSQTVSMLTNDVVLVRDASLGAGAATFFRVVPSNGAQNPELFLMQSDAANAATWARGRGSAVASSTGNGAGVAEGFSFTAPAADWYGLVLTNAAGSGNYTLHVDTSAPTGSVVIAGGASTRFPAVTLNHSAADAQTGVEAMRVSTDGALDTEAFVPYAATQAVTLPGPDGTKTVLAQYRNGAGMVSSVASDTILLDTRPDLRSSALSNPPANTLTGQTFSVTDSVVNKGGTTSPASVVRYYLSLDTVRGPGDRRFKAERNVAALAVDTYGTGSKTLRVPRNMAPGTYYLLACADGASVVTEADEGNNCRAATRRTTVSAAASATNGWLGAG